MPSIVRLKHEERDSAVTILDITAKHPHLRVPLAQPDHGAVNRLIGLPKNERRNLA
jgi:hypothetical protein